MPPWAGPCGGARAVLSLLPDGARVGHEQHELRAQRSALVVGDEQEQQRADVTRARSVTSRSSSALRISLAQRADPLGCTSLRHVGLARSGPRQKPPASLPTFSSQGEASTGNKPSDCLSVHYVGCRELATIEAHTVANHPQPAIQHMRLVGPTTGQHQPGREIDCGGPYLKHGGGVGPKKERICRFRSHLRAKYKRQCEILAVRFLRVPPVRPSMCAGVMGWMLEQGECSRIRGQQLVMHREARRTFESK